MENPEIIIHNVNMVSIYIDSIKEETIERMY